MTGFALLTTSTIAAADDRGRGHGTGRDLPDARSTPESLGWSTDGLDAVRERALELGSAAVLIVTDGSVVFSHGDVARTYRAHSIRKSFLSALYGIAIAEGTIDTAATLGELGITDTVALSDAEKQATVGDLLRCRSGVYLDAASVTSDQREARPDRHRHGPGTHWFYNNWDHNALGTIYREQTGRDLFEAFEHQIAIPIGMQDFDLADTRYQLEDVSVHPSYKFRISTRDLARFGVLYLNGGVWAGQPVIPAGWIEASTRAYSMTGRRGTKSGYGMLWWVAIDPSDAGESAIESGAYTASGTGGQRLTVLPGIDTVVVHRADTDDRDAARIGSTTYDRFLSLVLNARLVPDGAG